MIRIRNRAMTRTHDAGRKRSNFCNGILFSVLAAGAAVLAGITGTGYVTVLAADNMEQNQVMAGDDSLRLTGGGTFGDVDDVNIPDSQADDATGQVYDFKDNKTTGTVTVTKVWDDGLTNDEREIPDIKISTKKPSKSTLGYTVTFHGNTENGLLFDNGSDVNEVVINSSGQIVSGMFKAPGNTGAAALISWYSDEVCKNRVEVSDDGVPQMVLTGDLDLWAKEKTFEIKGYNYNVKNHNKFNALIPDTVTSVIFTDEIMPGSVTLIDVDADGDGGVVSWTEDNNTVMKVSTQVKGIKVQAAKNSGHMLYSRKKITVLDLSSLDTQNVTDMSSMFYGCSGLTSLDLSPLDTQKVMNMRSMFRECTGLTLLELSKLDTRNVTNMSGMFRQCSNLKELNISSFNMNNVTEISDVKSSGSYSVGAIFMNCSSLTYIDMPKTSKIKVENYSSLFSGCKSLTTIDLTSLDTSIATNMNYMFNGCSGLTSLDLSPLNTKKVIGMSSMFFGCSELTSLDLSPLNTQNVTNMWSMFYKCSGLISLDLSTLDTQKVTNMSYMLYNCSRLANLDLSTFDTQKVTSMYNMFGGCSRLTSLNLSSFNTQDVINMSDMFHDCYGLTVLDLSTFDTQNVTNMQSMFNGCFKLTSLDLSSLDTQNVTNMNYMFYSCSRLKTLKTGTNFKFVGTAYDLSGTWKNTAGETFTEGTFPSNVADTYTKISS